MAELSEANILATVVRLKYEVATNKRDKPLRLQLLGRFLTQQDWVDEARRMLEEEEAKKYAAEALIIRTYCEEAKEVTEATNASSSVSASFVVVPEYTNVLH